MLTAAKAQRPAARRRWNGSVPGAAEQHEHKRTAILHQAAKLFDERGYYETSLVDIARSLHVTKPTLYYYVKSKEDILTQIVERAVAGVEASAVRAREAGTSGSERLRLFARAYVEAINTDFGRCLLGLRRLPVGPRTHARIASGYRRIDTLVRVLITEGIADDSIRACDVRMATFALFGAMIWVPNWFRSDGTLSAARVGDELFELFYDGLRPPPVAKRAATRGSRVAARAR